MRNVIHTPTLVALPDKHSVWTLPIECFPPRPIDPCGGPLEPEPRKYMDYDQWKGLKDMELGSQLDYPGHRPLNDNPTF